MTVVPAPPPTEVLDERAVRQNLRFRVISSLILAPAALAAAYFGGLISGAIAAIVSVIVFFEWRYVTGGKGGLLPTIVGSGAIVVAVIATALGFHLIMVLALAIGAALAFGFASDGWAASGTFYAAALGVGLMALRFDDALGLQATSFVFAVAWLTDTGAFFIGRSVGGPRLWPLISPKKTWAGFGGGLVLGTVAGIVLAIAFGIPLSFGLVLVAIVLSAAVHVGDLFESALKRVFGIKDAGNLIPGHGGVMDRVDGLLVAGAVAALIGFLRAGPYEIGQGLLLW